MKPNTEEESTKFHKRAEDIFYQAIAMPEAEQELFVGTAAAEDFRLKEFVLQMVQYHLSTDADSFILETPFDRRPTALQSPNFQKGDRIDRYEIVKRIGEGGMGVVYRANQVEGIRRIVSLKVLKKRSVYPGFAERIEHEKKALAKLDHASISHIFDAGTTKNGDVYLVMDFIDGEPLSEFIQNHTLDLKDRLRLFLKIGAAIQHAHNKGIIHQDIKPSNIMVTQKDDELSVKIIDFGVAIFYNAEQESAENPRNNLIGGTPSYMSPEQLTGRWNAIDTRTDIFSLGLVLFDLLAGSLVFNQDYQHSFTYSLPLSSGSPAQGSARWRLEENLQKFNPLKIPYEAFAIVLKATAENPEHRYESVNHLCADVQHFLSNQVVEAVSGVRFYRIRKLFIRHKLAVSATFAAAICLLVLSLTSLYFAILFRSANQKNTLLVTQLRSAVSQLNEEHNQLKLAEKKVRRSKETQEYYSAVAVSFVELNQRFSKRLRQIFPGKSLSQLPPDQKDFLRRKYFRRLLTLSVDAPTESATWRLNQVLDTMALSSSNLAPANGKWKSLLPEWTKLALTDDRIYFARVLRTNYQRVFGIDDPRVADALNFQAATLIQSKRFDEALEVLEETKKYSFGDRNRRTVTSDQLRELARKESLNKTMH